MNTELITRLRSLETDHKPEGWPAIQMRDVSALLDAIEALEAEVERWKGIDRIAIERGDEIIKLRAQLAAAQGQEPVATVKAKSDAYGGTFVHWTALPVVGMKLYAAAPIPQQVAEPSVPEGWKLVPIEPTREMLLAEPARGYEMSVNRRDEVWKAMLAAAPQPKEPT